MNILRKLIALAYALALPCLLSSCDDARNSHGGNFDKFMSSDNGPDETKPVIRVLAVSPMLDPASRKAAAAQIEAEIEWLATRAAEGSEVAVVDACECRPVASLKAVPGVARVRIKALGKPVAAVQEFLCHTVPGAPEDGRANLPRLAQTLAQFHLPEGTHIVVFANPLFINDGADHVFDMRGSCPSDGMLFEKPELSVFSTLGREHALTGLYWHIGYLGGQIFVDDTHCQQVTRFESVYFSAMGATLVSFQPSFAVALSAAREDRREPLSHERPDTASKPEMLKITKRVRTVLNEVETDTRNHVVDQSAVQLDIYGNPKDARYDLGGETSLKGQRIALVLFDNDANAQDSPLADALRAKGATVTVVRPPLPKPAKWAALLKQTDQVWLWSTDKRGRLNAEHQRVIVDRWSSGELGVALLADNVPFVTEAQQVLAAVVPGATITGHYRGEQTLCARQGSSGGGFDARHPIFSGINCLFEGSTISRIDGRGLTPVCWASDGGPLLCTFQRGTSSRMAVFGGFTSYYRMYWDKSAGAGRLAVNLAAWLSNPEMSNSR